MTGSVTGSTTGTASVTAGVGGGVGLTALMVAAARAIEAARPDALARDVYAEHFVRAAPACADWPLHPDEVPAGEADPLWGRLGRYFGLRTRVFDDYLLSRAEAGTRQVVVLGAGLDTRAYRLAWPRGCAVFEVDQEAVLAFKEHVLRTTPYPGSAAGSDAARTAGVGRATAGTAAGARRIPVVADLRHEWIPALTAAGFDPSRPTTWLAEGLLLYLPSAAERLLINTVAAHSVPGSALAYEAKVTLESAAVRDSPVYTAARRRIGVDLPALFDPDPRPDSATALAGHGWRTWTDTPFDHSRRLGRGPLPVPDDALAANRWTFAEHVLR
ncbi:SAM-dependent methyltransferase [Streptomyces sp. NPDC026672]|uniref:SAM-dependent methyltransferase n=1 Tax=unclassified Streptomyces TaxID=2593676 RepID=UPI0033F8A817